LNRVKRREFLSELWLPVAPEKLFPFFGDAANLNAITPPWLSFRIVTKPPIVMQAGTLIDYRLRVRGIPLRWRTRINVWQPPHRFVDEQVRGPYRLWIHEHTLEQADGGTLVRDHVQYAVPLDLIIYPLMVRSDVRRIFEFRSQALQRRFPQQSERGGASNHMRLE
jgi:ligand-binding SRPBCC domain-containing protein